MKLKNYINKFYVRVRIWTPVPRRTNHTTYLWANSTALQIAVFITSICNNVYIYYYSTRSRWWHTRFCQPVNHHTWPSSCPPTSLADKDSAQRPNTSSQSPQDSGPEPDSGPSPALLKTSGRNFPCPSNLLSAFLPLNQNWRRFYFNPRTVCSLLHFLRTYDSSKWCLPSPFAWHIGALQVQYTYIHTYIHTYISHIS